MSWIESIPLPAVRCDLARRVVEANRLATKLFDRPAERLLSLPLEELRAPLDADGRSVPPAEIPLGDGCLLLFSDGSVVQRLQEQVYHLSRLASAGRLVTVIVHEINNALSGILGYAQLLADRPLEPEARRDLGMIHEEALRTARVAQNLLKFSRGGLGEWVHFSLAEVLRRCAELKRRDFALRSIQFELVLPDDLPTLRGDDALVAQVFINLFTNAHQSIASVRDRGHLRVTVRRTSRRVVIDVEDDGPGIPDALRERVFEPFFTRRPDHSGTGLGLTLCREILREHGGEIRARRGRLPGACLRIFFPVAAAVPGSPSGATTAGAVPARAPVTNRRIVVVEDEPTLRDLLTRAFSGNGNRTIVFERGEDALPYLAAEQVDLIVSDIHRPGLDGVQLYEHLGRTRPVLLRRMLFITGDTLSPETAAFLHRSRARCLKKPLMLDALLREAQSILERPSNQGELFQLEA